MHAQAQESGDAIARRAGPGAQSSGHARLSAAVSSLLTVWFPSCQAKRVVLRWRRVNADAWQATPLAWAWAPAVLRITVLCCFFDMHVLHLAHVRRRRKTRKWCCGGGVETLTPGRRRRWRGRNGGSRCSPRRWARLCAVSLGMAPPPLRCCRWGVAPLWMLRFQAHALVVCCTNVL